MEYFFPRTARAGDKGWRIKTKYWQKKQCLPLTESIKTFDKFNNNTAAGSPREAADPDDHVHGQLVIYMISGKVYRLIGRDGTPTRRPATAVYFSCKRMPRRHLFHSVSERKNISNISNDSLWEVFAFSWLLSFSCSCVNYTFSYQTFAFSTIFYNRSDYGDCVYCLFTKLSSLELRSVNIFFA